MDIDLTCSNLTTERACMDTYYCWWEYYDWMNVSAGGNCKDPFDYSDMNTSTFFQEWNPGCYIFDRNESKCNLVIGCNYTINNICESINENSTNVNVTT